MNRPAASKRERPTFPEIEAEYGEDPSRFLYSGIDPRPRIRALETESLARAWMTVEIERPGGPRREVVGAINERIAELQDAEPALGADVDKTVEA